MNLKGNYYLAKKTQNIPWLEILREINKMVIRNLKERKEHEKNDDEDSDDRLDGDHGETLIVDATCESNIH